MKILNIHIHNLASLEGEVTIDFTTPPLSTAGIFAITGPTGAGKSTILDAICLALYGRTPRYIQARETGVFVKDAQGSNIAQSDPRGILRDGAAEGSAAVTFVGIDKQPYQASWQVRRARNRPEGKLLDYTVQLKNIRTGDTIPGTRTILQRETERLVGLNFEQFTRSVLLAQGDFTAFLKAGKDEKSALLEKLTGTYIYSEISQIIFNHFRAEEAKLNDLRVRQNAVSLLREPAIQEIEAIIQVTEARIKEITAKLGISQLGIAWHNRSAELHQLVATAQEQHQRHLVEKQDILQREEKLRLVEAVQPTRSWADQWKAHQESLDHQSALSKEFKGKLLTLQTEQSAQQQQLDAANREIAVITEQKIALKPQIEAAKALDILLQEKTQVLDDYTLRLNEMIGKQKNLERQRTQLDSEAAAIRHKSIQTQDWLAKNKFRQPIAAEEQLILSKLQDAKQYLEEELQLNQEITELQVVAAKKETEIKKINAAIQKVSQEIKFGQEKLSSLNSALKVVSLEELEAAQVTVMNAGKELLKGELHWNALSKLRELQQQNEIKLVTSQQALANNEVAIGQLEPIISETHIQKSTTREMLDKAILAAANSVTDLREQLTPGDPCPVCGSTEHPYADHDPKSERILNQLKESLKVLEVKHDQVLAEHNQLLAAKEFNKEQIPLLSAAVQAGRVDLEQAEDTWQHFTFGNQIKDLSEDQISQWFQEQLTAHQTNENAYGIKIKKYRETKNALDTQNQSIQLLSEQLAQWQQEKGDLSIELKSYTQTIEHNQHQIQHAQLKLDTLKEAIGRYFPNESWFDNWKSKPEAFQLSITDFASQWTNFLETKNSQTIALESLEGKVDGLKNQIKEHTASLSQLQQQTGVVKQNYEESLLQRKALFDGIPIIEVEEKLESRSRSTALKLEAIKGAMAEQKTAITKYSTQINTLEVDMQSAEKKLHEFSSKLDEWILQHNQSKTPHRLQVTRSEIFELLALTPEWMASEKTLITRINQSVEYTAGTLENRKADWQHHQEKKTTTEKLPDLQAAEQSFQEQLEGLRNNKTEQLTLLRIDREEKAKLVKIIDVIEAQEKVFENWAKLNSLIGSADGKKFRQLAQEYTLDALLTYANHHLKTLSKRYLLQRIPETLALQILDQDMGDEVRTVYSLSGGESFLVSLSLALGLASLSSSRLKVESLFIDEGFGSLDAATLNIAMDALERLHDQGRKVGVISHVQELTERIPVQIMVHKQPSGKSSIEILNI